MNLCSWDFFALLQLLQAYLDFSIQPSAESLAILAQFQPFEERFRLVFVKVLYLLNCQLNTTHASSVVNRKANAIPRTKSYNVLAVQRAQTGSKLRQAS